MKKLMKKKVNVFGKTFSIFAILMVAMIGLASAALVPYLSNQVSGSATVDSPFVITMSDGLIAAPSAALTDALLSQDLMGGETYEATIRFENFADASMDAVEKFVITAVDPTGEAFPAGSQAFSCEDFESISYRTCHENGDNIGYCEEFRDDWTTLTLAECQAGETTGTITIPRTNHYDAGEVNMDQFKLKLKTNALGTYQLSAEVVPAII